MQKNVLFSTRFKQFVAAVLLLTSGLANAQWKEQTTGGSVGYYNAVRYDATGDLYTVLKDANNGNKATVQKQNGTSWSTVGTAGFSDYMVYSPTIAVNQANGDLYVAYIESVSGVYKLSCNKFNGTSWVDVGSAEFFITGGTGRPGMAINSSGNPVIVTPSSATKFDVLQFNGASWDILTTGATNTVPATAPLDVLNQYGGNGPEDKNNYFPFADSNGDIYVAVSSPLIASDGINVFKYSGGTWTKVGANLPGGGYDKFQRIVKAPDGTLYVAYSQTSNATPICKIYVHKWNGTSWVDITSGGTQIFNSTYSNFNGFSFDIAFDSNSVPYVLYQNTGNDWRAYVKKYNSSTSNWDMARSGQVGGFYMDAGMRLFVDNAGLPYYVGTSSSSEPRVYVVEDKPVFNTTSFLPSSGPIGTTVNIYGGNFTGTTNVSFNGTSSTFTVNSNTSITATVPANTTTGTISVTNAAGTSTTSSTYTVVIPPPTITSFTPSSGPVGTAVTITGTGFDTTAANNTVYFDGVKATITSASATQLVATFPAGTTGFSDIKVINTTNKLSAIANKKFYTTFVNTGFTGYTQGIAFAPKLDFTAVSNTFLSYGAFLKTPNLYADFNLDGKADYVQTGSTTTAVIPNTSTVGVISFGTVVTLSSGGNNTQVGDIDNDGLLDLIINDATTINVYKNTSTIGGTISFASPIAISFAVDNSKVLLKDMNGDGLLDLIGSNSSTIAYLLNTTTGSSISFNTASPVSITAPAAVVDFGVVNLDGNSQLDIIALHSTGYSVRLNSSAFSTVVANSNAAKNITLGDFNNDGYIDFVIDVSSTSVKFFQNDGTNIFTGTTISMPGGDLRGLVLAELNGNALPEIVTAQYIVNPSYLVANNTSTTGVSFSNGQTVLPSLSYNNLNPAANDVDGDGRPDLTTFYPSRNIFSVSRNIIGLPTISSFTPTSGNSGTSITITGTGFTGATDVTINGNSVTSFTVNSDTSITATVPLGTTGPIRVTNAGGTNISSSNFTYSSTIFTTGTLTAFSKCSGSESAAQTFTVSGANLTANLVVAAYTGLEYSLDGTNYLSTLSITPTSGTVASTSIYVRMTAASTSLTTGSISLTSTGATSLTKSVSGTVNVLPTITLGNVVAVVSSATTFTIPYSAITNSPTAYSVSTGTNALANFVPISDATFSGATGNLAVAIPANSAPGTYDFNLKVKIGTTGCESVVYAVPVTILQAAPTVTSFSPTSATVGTQVIITGTGFNTTRSNNIVYFGPTTAVVSAATATSLTVTVPPGATNANIVVLNTTNSLIGMSNDYFIPLYSPARSDIKSTDYAPRVSLAGLKGAYTVAVGDLDGDGKPDLAVGCNTNQNKITVYRNTSSSNIINGTSFASGVDYIVGAFPQSISIGDLDGDGKLDIVACNSNSNSISVLKNTSSSGTISASSFATKVDFTCGSFPLNAAIKDLDLDGKPEISVTNKNSNSISVFKNTTTPGVINTTSFAPKVDFTTGSQPITVVFADIDSDNKPDMVCTNGASGNISVFKNISTQGIISSNTFDTRIDFTVGTNPRIATFVDVDNDSKLDLVVTNNGSSSFSVLKNNSTAGTITSTSFAAKVDFTTGGSPYAISTGDINGDGKIDIAVTNSTNNTFSLFKNTGTNGTINSSSFAAKVDFPTIYNTYSVIIADLDLEGKPEIIYTNYSDTDLTQDISILKFNNFDVLGTLSSFTACLGSPSAAQTLTIQGDNLSANIVVAALTGYEYSLDGTNYSSTATIVPISGSVAATTLYVRLTGATAGSPSGNISISSTNATTVTVAVAGTVNTLPTITLGSISSGLVSSTSFNIPYTATTGSPNSYSVAVGTNALSSFTPIVNASFTGTSGNLAVAIPANSALGTYDFNVSVKNTTTGCTSTVYPVSFSINPPPPTITSFSPMTGEVGSTVTITGTNFNATAANNTVYFGSVKATITAATTTSLTVTVPKSSVYAPITVVCNSSLAKTNGFFRVVNNAIAPNSVSNSNFGSNIAISSTNGSWYSGWNDMYIAVGDFDNDGKVDVVKGGTNQVRVHRNLMTGPSTISTSSFDAGTNLTVSGRPRSIIVEDINSDGKLDIITGSDSGVSVLINTSTGSGSISFASAVNLASSYANTVRAADFDSDGKLDLVTIRSASVAIYRNTSSSSFSLAAEQVVNIPTLTSCSTMDVGDFNKDSKPDIVVSNSSNTAILLNGSSVGTIAFPNNVSLTGGGGSVVVADFDNEGDPDIYLSNRIIVNNYSSGTISSSDFSTFTYTADGGASAYSVSDLNGDGKVEIIGGSTWDANYLMLVGTLPISSTSISPLSYFVAKTYGYTAGIGLGVDVDGDNKVDYISAANYANIFSVTQNIMLPAPVISTSGTLTSFAKCAGVASATQTFTVSGSNLTANIGIAAVSGFEYSTDNSTFTSTLSIPFGSGTVAATTVYVRLTAASTGTPSGNISITSTGATSQTIAISGTVTALPTISTQPLASATLCQNSSYTLAATVTGASSYQWYSNLTNTNTAGTNLGNSNNAQTSALTPISTSAGTYYYYLVATSGNCSTTSTVSTITVNPLSVAGTATGTASICSGTTTSLSVSGNTGSIQWQQSADGSTGWANVTGATTVSYTTAALTATTYFRAVVTSGTCTAANSNTVQVTMNPISTISGTPTVRIGSTTTLTATNSSVTSSALNFDGSDDYATAPAGVYFDDNTFTIEGWVNVKSHAFYQRLIDFGNGPDNSNVFFMLSEATNGKPGFGNVNSSGQQDFIISNTAIPLNQWVHVAAVRDGSFAAIYINGVLTASSNSWTVNTENVTRTNCLIGKDNWGGITHLDGSIGELRFWSSARTLSQIQANMNTPVSPQTDLRLLYKFDQGVANQTNTGATTLNDQSGANYINGAPANGTLTNFALLTGSSSNWTYGRSAAQNGGWSSSNNAVATVDANGIVTGVAAGTTTITYTNALGCITTASITVIDCAAPFSNALSFGVGTTAANADYVQINSRIFPSQSVTNFTIETWVKPAASDIISGTPGGTWLSFLGYSGTKRSPSLYITNNGVLHASWTEGSAFNGSAVSANSPTTFTANKWTHVALVKEGTTMRIYVDGNLLTSLTCLANLDVPDNAYWLGKSDQQFSGSLDEVRFWSTARTQSQIQSTMNTELAGNETGLLAYFDFNQGVAGGTNTGITTVTNKANSALNGTLTNFTRTGTSSNFVGSTITNLDIVGVATICANGTSQYTHPIAGGTWSVSNGATATISSSGLLTASTAENITLTYSYTLNGCPFSVTKAVVITGSPTITTQPSTTSQTICINGTATALSVTATGSGLTYQWYKNTTAANTGGSILAGATAATYTPLTTAAGTTYYYCVVSGTCSLSTTSDASAAIIITPASVGGTVTAATASVCSGSTASLTLSGNTGTIQWQQLIGSTWTDISGETSATLTTPSLTAATSFRAKVTNGSCSVAYSNTINITLTAPPLAPGFGLDFDGSNDIITIPNSATYDYTTSSAFTIEAWVKINSSASSINTIVGKKAPGGGTSGYAFYINSWGTSDRKVVFEATGGTFISTTSIPNNTWTHVAVSVASGGAATIYINGVASGTGTVTIPSNSNSINVGAFGNNGYFYFNGSMDEVRIWNVAKSAAELNNNKNLDVTGSPNLALYYKFNEGTAALVNDKSTNANNGTLSNFALTGSTSNWVSSSFQDPVVITGNSKVCIGATTTLSHTITGGTWSSATPSVATIDPSTGVVTGVAVGTSVISYAYTYNGCSFTTTYTINVNALPVISGTTTVEVGGTTTLTATTTAATSNAWVSSNTNVATVTPNGLVTGVALGNATITFTNTNGCTDTNTVTVNLGTTLTPVLTSPASNTSGASTLQISYTLPEAPLVGSVRLMFTPVGGGTPIVWTMSNATSVSFAYAVGTTPTNSNIVSGTALAFGNYDVTLSYQDVYGSPVALVTNTNIQTAGSLTTPTLTAMAAITKTFGAASFTLTAPTSNSTGAITFTSSNTAVATISGNTVTIVGAGTATITASQAANGNYLSATTSTILTVNKATPTLGTLANITKTLGDASFTLTAPTSNSTGAITYTSSNTSVATISGNTVTIVGAGTATITASQATDTNYLAATTTVTITVSSGSTPTPVLISPAANTSVTNNTLQISYTLPVLPLSGSVKLIFTPTAGGTAIVWTMSNATSASFAYAVGTAPGNSNIVSGTALAFTSYNVTLSYQNTNGNPAASVTNSNIQTLAPPRIAVANTSYTGVINTAFTTINVTNTGGASTSFAITPSLPTGLTFNTSTGAISGTPTVALNTTTFTITATNTAGTASVQFSLLIDADSDGDGVPNSVEILQGTNPNSASSYLDSDHDGVPDYVELQLGTNPAVPDALDSDHDGISNYKEGYNYSNPNQSLDTDHDGVPDYLDQDSDGDGVLDINDAFPINRLEWTDSDHDGIGNNADPDDDNDGILDACDVDTNGDGIPDNGTDLDADGINDGCDPDIDGDGVINSRDNCPNTPNTNQADRDSDGLGDVCDTIEINASQAITPNGDGINDTWVIYNLANHPGSTVRVFNSNGTQVFYSANYQNNWTGHYQGSSEMLPVGSYLYQIDLGGDGSIDAQGWLYITK
jgi:gliding motility-associated-like protein